MEVPRQEHIRSVLTFYGSAKERKEKRKGWTSVNQFHVCITSYQLVVQDAASFRRKRWYYMILDEAQNIKNFQSQRWQTLLHFNTERRLLLTCKYEHVVKCALSRRQKQLYEEFMSRSSTRATLSSGSVVGMMGVLMKLRKVCNHPDLFEPRLIRTPFVTPALTLLVPSLLRLDKAPRTEHAPPVRNRVPPGRPRALRRHSKWVELQRHGLLLTSREFSPATRGDHARREALCATTQQLTRVCVGGGAVHVAVAGSHGRSRS